MDLLPYRSALLLDLDGTVADTHQLMFRCMDAVLQEHAQVPLTRQVLLRVVGLPLEQVFGAMLREQGASPDLAPELVRIYRQRRAREGDAGVRPFAGIPQVLHLLRSRGVRLAIVTTKAGHLARQTLLAADLENLFDVVVSGDQCTQCKPHPEPYLRAMHALGVTPAQTAAAGDTRHDIAGARAAGVFSAAACWGAEDRASLLAAAPDQILEKPADLLELFGTARPATFPPAG